MNLYIPLSDLFDTILKEEGHPIRMPLFLCALEDLWMIEFRMGEAAAQVIVVLDGLHEVGNGAGKTIALAPFLTPGLSAGNDADLHGLAATGDALDTEFVDARIIGVEELCCLDPGRIRDVRHPIREGGGVVCL